MGSPIFMAPEIWEKAADCYNPPVDMWAVGITLFNMVTGTFPFIGETAMGTGDLVKNKEPNWGGVWNSMSDDCMDLCMCLLEKKSWSRITVGEALEHPWFKKIRKSKEGIHLDAEIIDSLIDSKNTSSLKKACMSLMIKNLDKG